MNLRQLNELTESPRPYHNLLAQDITEWKFFLEIIEGYFKNRGIMNPIVVEIGLMHNAQKTFYQEFLGAEHIGIDINPNCNPDILGNSHAPNTMEALIGRLSGKKIDLLFIDGNHSYENVKKDYEIYAPLTKHIVVLHDISATVNSEVSRLWEEIRGDEKYLAITINKNNTKISPEKGSFKDMGIGILIKG